MTEERRESVEASARNVEEAIAQGLARLAVSRDEVEIEVLGEGSRGILGLMASEARVRLTLKALPEVIAPTPSLPRGVPEVGMEVLEELIGRMDLKATVSRREVEDPSTVILDVEGEDLGPLIGRRGETLGALEYIARLIVSRRLQRRVFLSVDVQEYRLRQEQRLRRLARRMARQAVQAGRPITLQPMSARDRRIVHLEVQEDPQVTTQSIGEGEERRVMILPRE